MLKGRLGLERVQIAHADRHGLLYLDRGNLSIVDGCLTFKSGGGVLDVGDYQLPHQTISALLIGPGTSLTHDVLRLLARHGTALVAVGTDGTRIYTAPFSAWEASTQSSYNSNNTNSDESDGWRTYRSYTSPFSSWVAPPPPARHRLIWTSRPWR